MLRPRSPVEACGKRVAGSVDCRGDGRPVSRDGDGGVASSGDSLYPLVRGELFHCPRSSALRPKGDRRSMSTQGTPGPRTPEAAQLEDNTKGAIAVADEAVRRN